MSLNDQITKVIEEAEKEGYCFFGIRHHHDTVSVGDDLGQSYNTIDDQQPEALEGICCMAINYDGFDVESIEEDVSDLISNHYQNGSVVLVAGRTMDYGNDQFELIIGDAKAIHVFN